MNYEEELKKEIEGIELELNPLGERNMRDMKREYALSILKAKLEGYQKAKEHYEKKHKEFIRLLKEFKFELRLSKQDLGIDFVKGVEAGMKNLWDQLLIEIDKLSKNIFIQLRRRL